MELKITPSGQTIVKPTALGPVANTDSKLLIYGLFQKGRVLAQDGVFVNADVTMSAHPVRQEQCYRIWAGHLVSCGIDERRAYEHFDEWASEDTYFPLDDELTAMREAGFDAECAWREPPNTLLVGRKK